VQVGVGPKAGTGYGQNSNEDYQQYEPLHVCLGDGVSYLAPDRREFFFDP
jgi:hypothetical protein